MKAELEIDLYADVEPEGIIRALYLGTACEPNFEGVESWEEIVERNIGYYLLPGSNTIRPADVEQLEKTIAGLEHAIALFREKIEQHKE
jgi:hypothetical protein